MTIKSEFLDCTCTSLEHIAKVELDVDADAQALPELSLTIKMNPDRGFFERLRAAFRFLFGLPSGCGEYDYIILTPASIDRLATLIVYWRIINKLRDAKQAKRALKERYSKP